MKAGAKWPRPPPQRHRNPGKWVKVTPQPRASMPFRLRLESQDAPGLVRGSARCDRASSQHRRRRDGRRCRRDGRRDRRPPVPRAAANLSILRDRRALAATGAPDRDPDRPDVEGRLDPLLGRGGRGRLQRCDDDGARQPLGLDLLLGELLAGATRVLPADVGFEGRHLRQGSRVPEASGWDEGPAGPARAVADRAALGRGQAWVGEDPAAAAPASGAVGRAANVVPSVPPSLSTEFPDCSYPAKRFTIIAAEASGSGFLSHHLSGLARLGYRRRSAQQQGGPGLGSHHIRGGDRGVDATARPGPRWYCVRSAIWPIARTSTSPTR